MAQIQNISVKVCGNPASNSGFDKLILYNSPSFEIEDRDYVGFDNCSYFYTIRTTNTQTIFKLVKNNVRSFGAIRSGFLVFAFSIPKNYKLDGGYTPYDVLNELKREFLEKCMTLKDPIRETYEFNPGRIDQHVLDEVASKFTISPQSSPNRVMSPNGPKGYIVENDIKIEELFHDINYPEFDNYSEVIVAESVTQTSYMPINNIQIPRPKSYAIFVDGVYQQSLTDINESIRVFTNLNSEYYNNKEVVFSIQRLKDGEFYPGIEIYEDEERITVSTLGWATPKRREIKLKIVPQKYENYFLANRNLLKVTYPFGEIPLKSNLSFTLEGDKIAEIYNGSIRLSFRTPNDKYSLISQNIDGDELRVMVEEIGRQPISPSVKGTEYKYLPIYDVSIKLKSEENLVGKKIDIKLKTRVNNDSSPITVATCCAKLGSIQKSNHVYECHFYVPKDFPHSYGYLCFQLKNKDYKSKDIYFDNEKIVVDDFAISNVKPFYKKRSFIIGLLKSFVAVLLGMIIGYATHDSIEGVFDSSDEPAVSVGMTSEQALDFLTEADNILRKKDLSFAKVDSLYSMYEQYKDTLRHIDEEKFDSKVCDRIDDYYKIVQYINNGEVKKIKEALKEYDNNDFHISQQHADLLKQIFNNDATIEQFNNNYSNISAFDQIGGVITPTRNTATFKCDNCGAILETEEKLAEHKKTHSIPQTYTCDICHQKIFDSKTKLNEHKSKDHQRHWDCEDCKKDRVPNYRFPSEEALKNHRIKYH